MYFKVPSTGQYDDPGANHYFHEMTHFVQANLLSGGMGQGPCWLIEGSAQFTGDSTTFKSDKDNYYEMSADRTSRLGELVTYLKKNNLSKESLLNALNTQYFGSESCNAGQAAMSYDLGMIVTEKIVSDFGWNKFISLLTGMGTTDFVTSFNSAFGLKSSDWYQNNFIPYFYSEVKSYGLQ
jgi:hypothetical protein